MILSRERKEEILKTKDDVLFFDDRKWVRCAHSHKTSLKNGFGYRIVLFLDKFLNYIQKKHPEMQVETIEKVLVDPDVVFWQKRGTVESKILERVIDNKIYRVVLRRSCEARGRKGKGNLPSCKSLTHIKNSIEVWSAYRVVRLTSKEEFFYRKMKSSKVDMYRGIPQYYYDLGIIKESI